MLQPPSQRKNCRFASHASVALLAAASIAFADQPTPATGSAPPAPASAGAALEFASPPYRVEGLGLSISLPVGAQVEATQIGAAERGFAMRSPDGKWLLRLITRASTDRSLTADEVAESLIEGLLASRAKVDPRTGRSVGSGAEVIDRSREVVVGDRRASRFYSRLPLLDGQEIINGYTVFQVEPGRFAVFQLDTTEAAFAQARPQYEMVVATALFENPGIAAAERKEGVDAAQAFLDELTPESLLAVIPSEPVFFRLYRPATTGAPGDAQEVAFQLLDIRQGARGELDPRKTKTRWTALERELGIVVSVHARYLEGARVIDSESICFLRPDRSGEAWTTRMQVKEAGKETGWSETGVREGDDIKVTIDVPASQPLLKQWRRPEAGYLSQVEGFLLAPLLARRGRDDVFQFYQYQPSAADIRIRRDELTAQAGVTEKDAGGFTLRTRRDPDAPEDVTLLDRSGRLLRRTLSGGVVMEPIDRAALEKLWKDKGLPF